VGRGGGGALWSGIVKRVKYLRHNFDIWELGLNERLKYFQL
jgi:hypothetical protein